MRTAPKSSNVEDVYPKVHMRPKLAGSNAAQITDFSVIQAITRNHLMLAIR